MLRAMESALAGKDFILGDRFSMADVIFGGTIRFMLRFKMLEATPVFSAYSERLGARPALQRSEAKNLAIAKEHGLNM
jgi:glutathione S-transferase